MQTYLTESEDIVLEVVEEYLSNNNSFDFQEILPFITSRFRTNSININKRGIKKILKTLIRKNIIVEGSSLTIQDVLDVPKRKKIYEYIKSHPGTYFGKILNDLKLSYNVLIWHLHILQKFEFIGKTRLNHHDVYFDFNIDPTEIEVSYYQNNPKSKQIIDYLKENDIGISKTKISNDLNIHINTVDKYLTLLEKNGIVTQERYGKKTMYFLDFSMMH